MRGNVEKKKRKRWQCDDNEDNLSDTEKNALFTVGGNEEICKFSSAYLLREQEGITKLIPGHSEVVCTCNCTGGECSFTGTV